MDSFLKFFNLVETCFEVRVFFLAKPLDIDRSSGVLQRDASLSGIIIRFWLCYPFRSSLSKRFESLDSKAFGHHERSAWMFQSKIWFSRSMERARD